MARAGARSALMALMLGAAGSAAAQDNERAGRLEQSTEELVTFLDAAGIAGIEKFRSGRACESAAPQPFVAPISGRVVTRFGERTIYGLVSKGVSLAGQPSARVAAPAQGIVLYAGEYRVYGKIIVLETSCRLHFVFAGMEGLAVTRGDAVVPGQTLGHLPPGGSELTPLLHVELHKSGKRVDPGPDISGR